MSVKANSFERQANLSVILAVVAGAAVTAAAVIALSRFNAAEMAIVMKNKGPRHLALLGAIAVAGLAATGGFFAGFNGAGHVRNKKSSLSWIGFFANSAIIAATLSLLAFFWLTKDLIAGTE